MDEALNHGALRAAVVAGLERTIWTPPPGVSDFDRVEAVQLLGQFRDPAANLGLFRVLRDAPGHVTPRPLGRWLRDTALDTLLRAPAQQGPATARGLAAYYNFLARLGHGRLERNVIYDDIPVLVRQGRGPLVLRAYVLPLLLVLVALVILPEVLDRLLRDSAAQSLDLLLGAVLFIALGLAAFNLHQVVLILLVAWFGARWPLFGVPRLGRKIALGTALALITSVVALAALLLTLRNAAFFSQASLDTARNVLLLLPPLIVPCYMLAHDLENDSAAVVAQGAGRGPVGAAVTLRWVSGFLYMVYVMGVYGLVFFSRALTSTGAQSDVDVLLAGLPFWLYLLVAPLPVLVLLAALGWFQRRGRSGRPQLPLPRGTP